MLHSFATFLDASLRRLGIRLGGGYRPERHYMRGPRPKTRGGDEARASRKNHRTAESGNG
jgi:hypothetical protein